MSVFSSNQSLEGPPGSAGTSKQCSGIVAHLDWGAASWPLLACHQAATTWFGT